MSRNNGERMDALAAEIKRQIGSAQNTRYLRSLPLFSTPRNDHDMFEDLLRRVDMAEARGRGGQSARNN